MRAPNGMEWLPRGHVPATRFMWALPPVELRGAGDACVKSGRRIDTSRLVIGDEERDEQDWIERGWRFASVIDAMSFVTSAAEAQNILGQLADEVSRVLPKGESIESWEKLPAIVRRLLAERPASAGEEAST